MSPCLNGVCRGPVEGGFVDVAIQMEVIYNGVGRLGCLCSKLFVVLVVVKQLFTFRYEGVCGLLLLCEQQ